VSNPPNVAGSTPLAFTTSLGEQLSVPLSAFSLSGSAIVFSGGPDGHVTLSKDLATGFAVSSGALSTGSAPGTVNGIELKQN
jgi:hypothetical protein